MPIDELRLGRFSLELVPPVGMSTQPCAEREVLVTGVQRCRGRVYVADNAILATALTPDGRHHSPLDDSGFHLALRDSSGNVQGCIRLNRYADAMDLQEFSVFDVIQRMPESIRGRYAAAAKAHNAWAEGLGLALGEVGGWAVTEEVRRSSAGITLAVAVFALSEILQNCALAAATTRNGSNAILTRLGGFPLKHDGEELGPVFDSVYGCEMQILGFHWKTSEKYRQMAAVLKRYLSKLLQGTAEAIA